MKKSKKSLPVSRQQKKQEPAFSQSNWLMLIFILIVIFIVYSPILNKNFINYDDDWYILNNPYLHPFSLSQIGNIFSTFYFGQYSPFPLTFLGILSNFAGDKPFLYNLSAILIHVVNAGLTCWLIYRLSKKPISALAVALLFGVCPLNVESVAWAAAIYKIGFYSIFFLSSLIAYTYYLSSQKFRYIVFSFILFILSCFSKEQAVALVLSLLCIDFFYKRDLFSRKVILEKIPFLLVSVIFGIITLMATNSNPGAFTFTHFSIPERILYACYALSEYIIKLFIPYYLNIHYPYPNSNEFSIWLFLYPLIIASLVYLFIRTKNKNRLIAFGLLFFIANLLFTLVLQIVSVRQSMMADRYVYLSSIGIYFLAFESFNIISSKKLKYLPVLALLIVTIFFSVITYARCGVWNNALSLWTDAINKDKKIPLAYNNRGFIYMEENKYDLAVNDFNKAIEIDSNYYKGYYNRGVLHMKSNNYTQSLDDLSNAIRLNSLFTEAYINRGILFKNMKKYDESLEDFNKAIKLNPRFVSLFYNRGMLFADQGKIKEAFQDYNKAIDQDPNNIDAYVNRGNLSRDQKNYDVALKDYNRAIDLRPGYPIIYFNRGTLYMNQKMYGEAINDFSKAISLNNNYAKAYYNRALAEYYAGKKDDACNDLRQAAQLNYQTAVDVLNQLCK